MRDSIEAALSPLDRALFRRDIDEVVDELREIEGDVIAAVAHRYSGALRKLLEEVHCAIGLCRRSVEERRSLEARFAALSESLAASESPDEHEDLLMEFLALITPEERLAGDRAAFRRYMGLDCVAERYQRALERKYMREEILVKTIAQLVPRIMTALSREQAEPGRDRVSVDGHEEPEDADPRRREAAAAKTALSRVNALLQELELEPFLLGQVRDAKRWQNRVTAFRAIGKLAASLPPAARARLLSAETSNFLVRCCLDQDENTWIQRGALELLCELSPREGLRALERRLLVSDPTRKDDFLVRGFAVFLLPRVTAEPRWVEILRRLLQKEKSEYVRMQVVRTLAGGRGTDAERLILELMRGDEAKRDKSPRVRAEGAIEWRKKAERDPSREEIASRIIAWLIRRDDSMLVRRIALEEAATLGAIRQRRQRKYKIDRIDQLILEAMDDVIRADPDVAVRRLAEEAREAIIVRNLPAFDWVEGKIAVPLAAMDEGSDLRISRQDFAVPEDLLGRILAYFTRDDFGLVIERRARDYVVKKGDRIRRRLWRILHELRNLDSAKRQAFTHTTGRVFRGQIRVHPGMMAELMETKVPGERLWNEAEQSWRRFLPLVDDYMSLFSWLPWRRQKTARIVSSQGITELRDTNGFFRGLGRYLRMSWRYATLAGLRNAHERNKVFSDPAKFCEVMRLEYGIETRFAPADYRYEGLVYPLEDSTLDAHFRHGAPPPPKLALKPDTGAAEAEIEAALAPIDALRTSAGTPATPAPALSRDDFDDTPGEGSPEAAAAGAEEADASFAPDDVAPDPDSIDALLRPLEQMEDDTGRLGASVSVSGSGSVSVSAGGGSGTADELTGAPIDEDTQDDLDGARPARAGANAFSPDETMPEIPFGPNDTADEPAPGVRRGDSTADVDASGSQRLGASGRLGDSSETADERGMNPLDLSTADVKLHPDSAGEISVGDATPAEPALADETPDDGIAKKDDDTHDEIEPPPGMDDDTKDDMVGPQNFPRSRGGAPADPREETGLEIVPGAPARASAAPDPDDTADTSGDATPPLGMTNPEETGEEKLP